MNDLQKKILDIYKAVSQLCIKNHLDYYAIGGTCIGAIRHRGFIPWDDDLDIAIPIEQFDRFKYIMHTQLPDNLYLYDCESKKEYRQLFCKVCDKTTTFIEETEKEYPNVYKGVYIDIMPLSGVPTDINEQIEMIKKLNLYRALNYIMRYPFSEMSTMKTKILWPLVHILNIKKPYTIYSDKSFSILHKYKMIDSDYVGYVWSYRLDKLIFPKEYFASYIDCVFEDTTIRCPSGYHKYLTQQFGDYMILPPESERIQHHPYIIDLEHSYTQYVQEGGRKK